MSAASLRARYVGDAVTTSSPQQVLVMLYDRLALDLERAQREVAAGNRIGASDQLQHAQEIVLELLSSLQVDVWEGGPRLAALYRWLIGELVQAAPYLTLLITSHIALRLAGEYAYLIAPLALPDPHTLPELDRMPSHDQMPDHLAVWSGWRYWPPQ